MASNQGSPTRHLPGVWIGRVLFVTGMVILVAGGLFGVLKIQDQLRSINRLETIVDYSYEQEFRIALKTWEDVIALADPDPFKACNDALRFGRSVVFFAFDSNGVQVCGPTVAHYELKTDEWAVQGDDTFVYTKRTYTGLVQGLALQAGELSPAHWEEIDRTATIIYAGRSILSTNTVIKPGTLVKDIGEDAQRGIPISGTNFLILTDETPNANEFHVWSLVISRLLGFALFFSGAYLCIRTPFQTWWHDRGAPDGVRLFVVDNKGQPQSWSAAKNKNMIDDLPGIIMGVGAGVLADVLQRARSGETGATKTFVFNGVQYRFLVMTWSHLLRRGVVLVSKPYMNPFEGMFRVESNLSRASAFALDGTPIELRSDHVVFLGLRGTDTSGPDGMFRNDQDVTLKSLAERARRNPGKFIRGSMSVGLRDLDLYMVTDSRLTTYLWITDVSSTRIRKSLESFLEDVTDYIADPTRKRPDLNAYRKQLDPQGISLPPTLSSEQSAENFGGGEESGDKAAQEVVNTVVRITDLLAFVEKSMFASSSVFFQRNRAARRKEIARVIHDLIIQDLVDIRWLLEGKNSEAATRCDKVIMKTRELVKSLRTPPWEYQIQSILETLAQPIKERGISVTITVTLEDPIEKKLVLGVATVAKETLTNAARHGSPSEISVDVRITNRSSLVLIVTDDGTSALPAEKQPGDHFGLRQCHEVANDLQGTFSFEQHLYGHVATFQIPLQGEVNDNDSDRVFSEEINRFYVTDTEAEGF
jgi:signal transduction histidine kinase